MKKKFSSAAILAVMFCTTVFAVSAHSTPCQTLTLSLSSSTIDYGQPVTLTATISSGTNTGTITFYRHPNAIALGTATVASNEGSASVVPTVSGSFTITAQYTTAGGTTLVSNAETLTVNPIAITSDFSSSTAWTMSNGILNVTYDPAIDAVTQISAVINGSTQTILNHSVADPNIGHGTSSPEIYNVFGAAAGATAGPASDSTSSSAVGSNYVDFWTTQPVDSVSTINLEHHYVMYEGFPALVFYVQLTHSSTAGALTDFGDSYIILPSDLNFTSLYYSNYSFNSLGKFSANFPTFAEQYAASQIGNPGCNPSCSGRNVGKETIEYTGLSSISDIYENYVMSSGVSGTIDRNFITKYDYANADEFHNPRGYIGQGGVAEWVVFPTMETHTGGPNQVDLMGVSQGPGMMTIGWASNHLGGSQYTPPQGVDTTRFFGPFVYYFNGTPVTPQAMGTEAALQSDATDQMTAMIPLFADDATMVADGYIPLGSTTQRASTSVTVANSAGWPTTSSYSNLAILSDPNVNFQTSNLGYQYWSYINSSGVATFTGIRPGTYRLSVYERGQFGEMRNDGNTFVAGGTSAMANMTYQPETFGTTVWTIGTPDRSAHEFEYGNVPGGGPDLNQFPASYDYWGGLDSSAVQGAVVHSSLMSLTFD